LSFKNNLKTDEYYASGIKLPKQDNYEIAYREAADEFAKKEIKDFPGLSEIGINNENNNIVVPFLNKEIIISYPDLSIIYRNNKDVELWLKILLLRYLSRVNALIAPGELITFKQIPGGLAYYTNFQKRSIIPLLKTFAGNYELFISVTEKIGGVRSDYSNYSVSFRVFPGIVIIFNIWEGDDEIPADGNVIFDSSIINYFSSEDIVVLCNMIAVMIIKNK
jgi:hypothetical protein